MREADPYSTEEFVEEVFEEDYHAKCGKGSDYVPWAFEVCTASGERVAACDGDYWFGGMVINRLMVAPGWRKHGLGSLLIRHALRYTYSLGARCACVMTFEYQG